MQKKNNVRNPLTNDGTAAVIAALPTFTIAEMIFHVNPVAGSILGGAAGMVAWRHWDDALRALDSFINWRDAPAMPSKSRQDGLVQDEKAPTQVERSKGIILGNDKFGKPISRKLKQLKNILIMGAPGQGKSSLACWLLSQMAVEYGAKFIIIDKNAKGGESLTTRFSMFERSFLRPPAYRVTDICNSIEYAHSMLERRQEGEESTDTPLILVVDEYTRTCMDERTKHITSVIEDFNALGRQFNCFSLCCGQLVNASRTGGTEVRELFATRMILGMKEKQAQMIIPEAAKQAPRLLPGECICDTEGREEPFRFSFPDKSQKYYREQALHARPHTTNIDQESSDFSNSSLDHKDQATTTRDDHSNASDADNDVVTCETNLVEVLARYKRGESIRSIGADFGISSGDDRKALKELLDTVVQHEEGN